MTISAHFSVTKSNCNFCNCFGEACNCALHCKLLLLLQPSAKSSNPCYLSSEALRWRARCVLPPVLMQQPDFHRTDFSEISFWELFLKIVKSFRLWLKSDKNNRQFSTQSLELLWIKDRPVAEISTRQHTTFTRDRDPCTSRVLYLKFPANERS